MSILAKSDFVLSIRLVASSNPSLWKKEDAGRATPTVAPEAIAGEAVAMEASGVGQPRMAV